MGLFKKKPNKQDMLDARDYVSRMLREVNEVSDRVHEQLRSNVQLSSLLILCFLGSGTLSKNVKEQTVPEMIQFLKANQVHDADSMVPILLDRIGRTFQDALKKKENPLKTLYKDYYEDGQITGKQICQNPFFLVDIKKTINTVIDKGRISSLYSYKFTEEELQYPEPRCYINESKAPVKVFTKADANTPEYFSRVALVDYKQDTYSFYFNASDQLIVCKEVATIDGTTRVQFFNGSKQEYDELYNTYEDLRLTYFIYTSPMY